MYRRNKEVDLNNTHSGRVFKNKNRCNFSNQQLQAGFGTQSKKQRRITRELYRSGELNIEGDYV